MKITQFIFSFLLVMFLCGFGCSSPKPTPDPLVGFHEADLRDLHSNKIITDDYNAYIQTLSPEERRNVSPVRIFEDGLGGHAVDVIIGINGRGWRHILIYDKDNRRIKTIKYATGYYAS